MTTYKQKPWGIAIYRNKHQVGAAVGMPIHVVLGRGFASKEEARIWRKHGVARDADPIPQAA